MTTLLEEIQAKCTTEMIAARNELAISEILSAGRKRVNSVEIGSGTVLEVLGITAANTFLDVIAANPAFRYVKPLLDQGRLKIGSPLVQATIKSMVPSVISQEHADALCALGFTDDVVSTYDISKALEGI